MIDAALRPHHLAVFGRLNIDGQGIMLLGPREPGFWAHFTNSPEWQDNQLDPIDRWSTRIITQIANDIGATPRFPFGGDAAPFLTWALQSDAAWQSPVGMVVHATTGLMVSYRGALVFDHFIDTQTYENPCDDCAKPCTTACPISALVPTGYDVPLCHSHLRARQGADCAQGCLVRRSCPISQNYARQPDHSAYHMRVFLGS